MSDGEVNGDVNRATMSDAVDQLAQALRDLINEAVQAAVGRQHHVRTTPVPANAAQTHQDDDNAGGTAEAGAGPVNGGVREHSRLEEYARGG